MRYYILFVLVFFVACKPEGSDTKQSSADIPNFRWLIGDWQRINDEEGKITYEKWLPTHAGIYLGHGYTLAQNDTVFQERLALKPVGKSDRANFKNWALEVTGVNEEPTVFRLQDYTDSSFTVVNLKNEFPTHIKYYIQQDTLKAIVRNAEWSIDFAFVKN
ncbi:DUF6265 family protein [Nonlabens agnitus]|uniref:DUF6265 domain-containing protein n=1 Tax=Nonlabens agnitus TaxID=870484 RepID=A0A2S9WWC4_9FLAO|nr:DUF6265 family protein [Nonlabens agnitus]PRP67754.1 hypothetical protein BST86_11945 [Nonlabens agnitus]